MCFADSCFKCKKPGGELLCDYCYRYYHVECVPVMPSIFETDWCPECYSDYELEKIITWRPYDDLYKYKYHYHKMKKELVDVYYLLIINLIEITCNSNKLYKMYN